MATRIPLIVNASAYQIQELPTGDSLTGIATLTATTLVCTSAQSTNLNVTGITTIVTLDATSLRSTNLNVTGISTIATLTATSLQSTNLNVTGISTVATLTATSLQSTNLNVTGISTVANLTSQNINSSGIITATSFVKSGGTSSQFLKADGSVTGIITASNLDGSQSGSAPIYGVRAYGKMKDGQTATPSLQYGGNVNTPVQRVSTGRYRFTLSVGIGNSNYVVTASTGQEVTLDHKCTVGIVSATAFDIFTYDGNNEVQNTDFIHFTVVG